VLSSSRDHRASQLGVGSQDPKVDQAVFERAGNERGEAADELRMAIMLRQASLGKEDAM